MKESRPASPVPDDEERGFIDDRIFDFFTAVDFLVDVHR
jgi:hypothetical protein